MGLLNLIQSAVDFKSNIEVVKKELTLHDKIDKFHYLDLKKMCKLYSASARSIREAAIRNKGEVRGHLRFLKNKEGQIARVYHVTLCFLKGKKYPEVEPNVEKKNRITANQIKAQLACRVSRTYYAQLDADLAKFFGEVK